VLGAIFDPLDGHARLAADGGEKDDVRKNGLLDTETSAAARRRDEAKSVARHTQCAGHERLDHERPLEVRPYRVTVRGPFELRNDAERLHRRGGIARIRVRELEHSISHGKGSIRVAVAEAAPAYDVRTDPLVDHRGVARGGASQVGRCRKHFIFDADQVARVFRDVTRVRNYHGNGLADVSYPVDCDGIVGERSLHDARHRSNQIADVLAGDDAPNPWQVPRSREIDPSDPCVRMGRTQDRCKADSRNWREIVDKACLPGQERLIFLALNGRADPSLRHIPDCFQQNAVHLGKPLTSPFWPFRLVA
jgi:hypothetical protein